MEIALSFFVVTTAIFGINSLFMERKYRDEKKAFRNFRDEVERNERDEALLREVKKQTSQQIAVALSQHFAASHLHEEDD